MRIGVIGAVIVALVLIIYSVLWTFWVWFLTRLFSSGMVVVTPIPYILMSRVRFLRLTMIVLF
uniref:acetyl-CoA carboxylase beta subunit n=1 Tax=Piper bambusifolium TaxID=1465736 RepID=UPI001FAF5E17|nr:acetyl-CoA carboxylase beta subunit [Piper bambusifolium]UJH18312.1 acetyl-CoA carboxylase beta subunit [Piper bambusifolium]